MSSATPLPEAEPIETVVPRLLGCMEAVIAGLRSRGVAVDTCNTFLLDLTHWTFQVPQALDGVPVQMSFVGSVPGWSDRVRYHLQVSLLGERRWSLCEPQRGFNVPLIVDRIVNQLDHHKRERAAREQVVRNRALAEERISSLGATLGISQDTSLVLRQDNLRVEGLAESPDDVQITVRTSHANAEKIAREYRASGRRARKVEGP